jgi:hypothetical protein
MKVEKSIMKYLFLPFCLLLLVLYLRERVRRPLVVRCDGGEGQWIDDLNEELTSDRSIDA